MIYKTAIRTLAKCAVSCTASVFLVSTQAQDAAIFSGLPYDENYIRDKINEYAVSITSESSPEYIPANLYYNLIYKEILSRPQLLLELPLRDANLIRNLPAHTHHVFLDEDHRELSGICTQLQDATDDSEEIVALARRFDNSRLRRQRLLNSHYAGVRDSLSDNTTRLVDTMLVEYTASKNITYAVFDMGGFAEELPLAARNMLQSGCNEFFTLLENYTPRTMTLNEEMQKALVPFE